MMMTKIDIIYCVSRYNFFFSSRRRHTRYIGDWSSDVCSSDLWRRRPVSDHAAQDRELERRIQRLFQQHRGTYGSPRIHRALHAEGCTVSRRRVARLMRTAGLRARVVQIYRANPRLHRFYGQHPNRVWARVATRPDQIWVGDITYLPVGGRWRFLAVVLDQ